MTELPTVRPFSNGSQFGDWSDSNCYRCKKFDPERMGTCEIADALTTAYCGDGTVTPEIARRMGRREDEGRYVWPCGEVDWSEAWRAEVRARQMDAKG